MRINKLLLSIISYSYGEDQQIRKSTAEFLEKELGWKSV